MTKRLDVYVLDHHVGWLSDEGDRYVFSYLPDTAAAYLVSLTMPVRAESYIWQRGLFPFFQQNLPEGYKKDVIRQKLGPHADVSDWGLLALTGKLSIGRVRVVPSGMPLTNTLQNLDMSQILASPDSQASLLNYLNEGVLEGISGVMPKVMKESDKATVWTDDFILKTGTPGIPGLAINEYLCLEVARAAGLDVPETALSDDGQVLAVARFDRRDGVRVALEDFCSIKALDPVNKYKASLEEIAKLHNEYVAPKHRQTSARQLYRMLLLNYALHNGDAHLKNFSLIYSTPDDAVMAPVYDVVTTSAYPNMDDMPALTLLGKKAWWMGKALRQFAANRLSLTQKERDEAEHAIVQAIDYILPMIVQMIEKYPFFRETGKRMMIEWASGKIDITEGAKKRLGKKTDVLEEMKLSDVQPVLKKANPYGDQTNSLNIKKPT
jgi:serine/threonine-protein kinase HipA